MTVSEGLRAFTAAAEMPVAGSDRGSVPYRAPVYFACTLLALATNYLLGKDSAWDTLNYHLYLGFSAVNDRFGQDYFAAGSLGYLNPFAYVPLYALVRAGLPALLICSIFAIVHSVILWLTYELGVAVCPAKDDRTRLLAGASAVALAFMNPVLMQQIGSCFADITTAELALGGWLLLASAIRAPRVSRILCAGLILGAATSLKLSNALPAVSAFAMLIALPLDWRSKIRYGSLYGISLGLGFAVVAAPWSYRLFTVFGNPMFPMFNNIVRSPEFTTEAMTNDRFAPESIGDALWRPFAMLDPARMVHEELSAPDPRYAILVVLVILFVARWIWRRFREPSPSANKHPLDDSSRVLAAIGCAVGINWMLWLYASGNSRYVLTMACAAAAVVIGLLFLLFKSQPKIRNYILFAIFATQAIQLYFGAEYRWNGTPWGGPWFDISVPRELKTERNLYLSYGIQSNTFVAPFLSEDSGFVNFAGGFTLDPDGANGARVKALIRRFAPNIRVLFDGGSQFNNADSRASRTQTVDGALERFGLNIDTRECATIVIHGLRPELEVQHAGSEPSDPQLRDTTKLLACRLIANTSEQSANIARQRAVDVVFDRIEDACPKLFRPRRLVTAHDGDAWRRHYGGTDISAWISYGRVKFADYVRPAGVFDIGSESDWARAPLRLECGSRNGVYFAHILPSN